MIRTAVPLVLLLATGCTVGPVEVVTSHDLTLEIRRITEEVQAGRRRGTSFWAAAEFVSQFERAGRQSSGLTQSLDLVDAVTRPDRTERIELLERTASDATVPVSGKIAAHLLEQDDAYLASTIENDRIYSTATSLLNGALRMGRSFLTGNVVGFVRPFVDGLDWSISDSELDPRSRKLLDLERRWLIEHGTESELPDGLSAVREMVADLEQQTFELETELARRLIGDQRLDAAAAHLHLAHRIQPGAIQVVDLSRQVSDAIERERLRLRESLNVRPVELDLMRANPRLAHDYLNLVHQILLAGQPDQAAALIRRFGEAAGNSLLKSAVGRAEAFLRPRQPWVEVEVARQRQRDRRWRYLLSGRRGYSGPAGRYPTAGDTGRSTLMDLLEPLLWAPRFLFRAASAIVVDPVDDQDIVDVLARLSRSAVSFDDRQAALEELARRYEQRGQHQKALVAASAAEWPAAEFERLEQLVALDLLNRARAAPSPEARAATLSWLVSEHPATEAAEQARVQLELLGESRPEQAQAFPGALLRQVAAELGLEPTQLDGEPGNGEFVNATAFLRDQRLEFEVERAGRREHRRLALEAPLWERLQALAAEFAWRRRAAGVSTYRDLHEGVPVEFYVGFGTTGISFYPRLLPEDYNSADRRLYQ